MRQREMSALVGKINSRSMSGGVVDDTILERGTPTQDTEVDATRRQDVRMCDVY